MKAQQYAEALYRAATGATEEKVEQLVANLLRLLKSNGQERLLPAIVSSLEKYAKRKHHGGAAWVVVSDRRDTTVLQETIERDLRELGAEELPVEHTIDPTLIGGYKVRARGVQIDASYKSSLLQLYHSLSSAR